MARRASADWYELAAAATLVLVVLGGGAAVAGGVLARERAPRASADWSLVPAAPGGGAAVFDGALACSRGALTGQRDCQLRCPAADRTSSTRRAGVELLGLNTTISALMIRLVMRSTL